MADAPKIDTEHRDDPVCPFCGEANEEPDEWDFECGPPYDGEVREGCTCQWCDKTFTVTAHVTYTFTTRKPTEVVG